MIQTDSSVNFMPQPQEKSPEYDLPLSEDYHQGVADNLNMLQTGWSAKVYHNRMVGKTQRDINSRAGLKRNIALADQVGAPGGPVGASSFAQVRRKLRRTNQDPIDYSLLQQYLHGPKGKAD